jgi:hypothetical protein
MTGERRARPGRDLAVSARPPTREIEGTDAAVTSETPLQQLLRALVRFWWVAILGILLAGVAFVFATYNVTLGVPPKLDARTKPTYSASTQLLVTSKGEPYFSSTNVSARTVKLGETTTTDANGTETKTQDTGYDSAGGADGDLQRLVEIANSLPPRVTSDTVIRLRNKTYGRIAGTVTAVNPFAFSGAGGFRSGPLPYVKVTGTAGSPQDAIDITNQTAQAFITWFKQGQVANHIAPANRVIVQQVNSASTASAQGGSKPLVGVAAAALILIGAAGLALALERLIPRRSRRAQRAAAPPAPVVTADAVEVPLDEPALPALDVPTMTLAAEVENGAKTPKAKPARPRKSSTNGSGSTGRRRAAATASRVAPSADDAV